MKILKYLSLFIIISFLHTAETVKEEEKPKEGETKTEEPKEPEKSAPV